MPTLDGSVLQTLARTTRPLTGRELRAEIASWQLKPTRAALYGSAARADGGVDSDIDLLVVHGRIAGAAGTGDHERWRDAIVLHGKPINQLIAEVTGRRS